MESKTKIIQVLKGLLTVCRAGEAAFTAAADALEGSTAKELMRSCAQQHREFADELRGEIRFHSDADFDADPPKDAWQEIFLAIQSGDDEQILAACERMEEALMRIYKDALSLHMPWDVETVLSHQYSDIKNATFFLGALELFSNHQVAV